MSDILIRWMGSALGLLLAAYLVPGIQVSGFGRALIAAAVLGLVNLLIRPLIFLFTLPINLLTFGLFTFVINGFMLWITSQVVKGFEVSGFFAALFGSLILMLFNLAVNKALEG